MLQIYIMAVTFSAGADGIMVLVLTLLLQRKKHIFEIYWYPSAFAANLQQFIMFANHTKIIEEFTSLAFLSQLVCNHIIQNIEVGQKHDTLFSAYLSSGSSPSKLFCLNLLVYGI